MRRMRLDIGAVTATNEENGTFVFFLYKRDMERCLPIALSPPDMHAVLSNFTNKPSDSISVHSLFGDVLQNFKIELLEITIVRNKSKECFYTKLLFFDGEREITKDASFIDGIILSKNFSAPIYISESLMNKYSTEIELLPNEAIKSECHLEKLKEQLKEAINIEDYEKAALINKEIAKFDNN